MELVEKIQMALDTIEGKPTYGMSESDAIHFRTRRVEGLLIEIMDEVKGINPFTGCKCKLYEEKARCFLEAKINALEIENKILKNAKE